MTEHINVEDKSGVPLYRQIINQILTAIAAKRLQPGAKLPTVRQLAIDLEVNPNTVARAYRELEILGIITTQRGTGSFVASKSNTARDEAVHRTRIENYADGIVAEAARIGISLKELVQALEDRMNDRR